MISEKIREARKERNRTQGELAEAIGVSQRVVSKWELGHSEPDSSYLGKIATYFAVPVDYFLDDSIEFPVDPVREAIEKLKEMGFLKDPDKITDHERSFIMDAVRQDLRMQQLKDIKKQED